MHASSRNQPRTAFTLIELLTTIAIIAILASILIAVVGNAREQARAIQCSTNLRTLGTAIHLHANDNDGKIPPSLHSAALRRQQNWAWQIREYIHQAPVPDSETWDLLFDRYYRCPVHPATGARTYSYGLNVYFELNPEFDSYKGSPKTWERFDDLPAISQTILLAETRPTAYGDHFMAHDWNSPAAAENAVDHNRHSGKSNFLFADGSVHRLRVEETFNPPHKIDLWHPEPQF